MTEAHIRGIACPPTRRLYTCPRKAPTNPKLGSSVGIGTRNTKNVFQNRFQGIAILHRLPGGPCANTLSSRSIMPRNENESRLLKTGSIRHNFAPFQLISSHKAANAHADGGSVATLEIARIPRLRRRVFIYFYLLRCLSSVPEGHVKGV